MTIDKNPAINHEKNFFGIPIQCIVCITGTLATPNKNTNRKSESSHGGGARITTHVDSRIPAARNHVNVLLYLSATIAAIVSLIRRPSNPSNVFAGQCPVSVEKGSDA